MISVGSAGFLLFAALLTLLWYRTPVLRRWQLMLVAGVLFYVSLDGKGFPILLASTACVWWAAPRAAEGQKGAKWFGLAASLGPLLVLKYTGMVWSGALHWLQPLGLAYYSMQLIGYWADVYRHRIKAESNFARLLCYVSFFPCITQGPFNRYDDLMPQFDATPLRCDSQRLWYGCMRMAWGYFKKLAIAERAAIVVNTAFADPAKFNRAQLIFAAVMFTVQLYADFSGYTDIVLGLGEMLGLRLPENFRQPYFAASVKELWNRWHISLSRWFRDYVYIPLGGNRKGKLRQTCNLLVTFLVSGLWHGASLTFVVWGALHGIAQALENHLPLSRAPRGVERVFRALATYAFMVATCVIFHADSLVAAMAYLKGIVCQPETAVFSIYWELGLTSRLELLMLLAGTVMLFAVDLLHERGVHLRQWVAAQRTLLRWAVYECAIFGFLLMGYFLSGGSFLYARF